jgi:NAD-reducing hydrogenase large subunit
MHDLITIDPVTRIEGHAKVTIRLDEAGRVADARFHVAEFRGFEEFCRGRPVWEMPSLTARTCGICPVSHLLASAKAGDMIMGVDPPPAGLALRTLVNLGQITQSHALSFFHLSAPDLLLGMEADPAIRNVFGLMAAEPEVARRGIRLRSFGQRIIEIIAGRKVHSPGVVPGGIAHAMAIESRDEIAAGLAEAKVSALDALELYLSVADRFQREIAAFGDFPSMFMGMVAPDGTWEHHSGDVRVIDVDGSVVVDRIDPLEYRSVLGEAANRDSYLKSPYLKERAPGETPVSEGMYRVGPLARINICDRMGTPLADEALSRLRERHGRILTSSFHYHHARLIEVIAALERIELLLADPILLDERVRADAGVNRRRGVGISEAPRGTLFHDYVVDEHGVLTDVNMIIATGHNNLAMNATVAQIAREWIDGPEVPEGTLNRIEAGVRCYDPCLSCSTHALGAMPMVLSVVDADGHEVAHVRRD